MNLRTKILLVLALWITTGYVHAQSDNCATATPLTLVNGQLCVNGTTQNATSNNTMYGSCNPNPVNEVWYTYVAAGGQNDYTITSNGMTNAEIVIDITGCVDTLFSTCDVTTGTSTLSTSWGITPGTQVLIMIASNGGVDGDFQFCVDSYDPPPGGGNACTGAIPLCDKTQTYNFPDMSVLSSSGISSTCFPGAGNQDLWYQFTVVQSGTLEWEATPSGVDIELDWSLWDITSGCPGAEVACNYNFTAGLFSPSISAPVGMIGTTSCVACPTGGNMQAVCGEYCDPITVTAGNTYAILIDNYTTALPTGLDFVFGSGMTAEIAPNADFTINPSGITCGSNITINIADLSLGIPDWTFGNGNTFTGNNPPAQTYTVPGVYAITASISGSCPSIHTEYVEIYGPLTATTTATNENCSACDGTASVTAAGGDGVFSYQWSNLATTPNISGLCTGTYSVTVSNATCGTQVIETVVVGSGGLFPFTVTNTNTACPGDSTGTATFTALSGNAPYTYLWSNGNTSSTAVGLSAGVYSVTVADVFGCDTNTTVTINDPSPVLIDASNVVITNASCTGADGSIIGITASGGTGALTYSWVDGSSTVVGTAADLTLVGTGSYTLLVTDANNCSATSGPYFVVATTATAVTMTGGATNCYQSCDASGSASAGGGTPPYFYSWSTNPAQTSNIATGLCQGTYYVTVTDASCSASGIELAANGDFSAGNSGFTSSYYFCNSGGCLGPEGGFGVGTSGAFYNGGFTGVDNTTGSGNFMVVNGSVTAGAQIWCQTITVNPNTNYQFSTWLSSMNTSNVAVLQFSVNNTPFGTVFNAPGSTGTWIQFFETWNSGTNTSATICIINQNTNSSGNDFGLDDISFQECVNGCPTIDSLVITEPIEISVVPMKSDALCNASCDGTASVIVSGGTFPYTYLWSSSGTSSTETALCAGTYSVTITDLNGCDTIIAIPITEPTFLGSTGSTVAEKCENGDGEATVTPFGGSPSYTFLWDDPLQQTTATATGLVTQTYNVLITDSLGCTFTLPLSVSEILGPDIDSLKGTDLLCAGDADATAEVFVSGASPPFTYLWDDPATQISSTATNLGAGTYSVTVTDLFGCDSSQTITIVDPPLLSVSVSGTPTLCFGETPGNLNAAASGGQGPYTYSWDDPNTSTTAAVVLLTPTSGTYTVLLTDSTGCTATDFIDIVVGPALVASVSPVIICEGDATTISVNPSGGDGPPYNYTYIWDDPANSTTQSISVSPLATTTFNVTVDDGCSTPTFEAVLVTVGPKPIALFSAECLPNLFYTQFTDLSTVNGGTISSWSWDFDDASTSSDQNPPPHNYASTATYTVSLTVTANGCSDTYITSVESAPTANFTANPIETTTANPTIEFTDGSSSDVVAWEWVFGDNDTSYTFVPGFGTGSSLSHTYDSSGVYAIVLSVTNAQGCIDTSLEYIRIIEEYILFAPNVFTPNGNGINEYFQPVGVGINPDKYELLIFDRWGDLIYESTDYDDRGWDGRANGGRRQAQADVYIWVINTVDPALTKHQYIGHVTLIK